MAEQYVQYMTVTEFQKVLQEGLKPFLEQMKLKIEENANKQSELVNIKIVMGKLQVTKPTIYNWIKKGIIQPQKIGGKVLFDLAKILRDIKSTDMKWQFGRGRDYLYRNTDNPNQETKEERRYYRLKGKKMQKEPLNQEEEEFLNNFEIPKRVII